MKYGLSEITIQAINVVFQNFQQIDFAILYGSRAKGNFRINSDIDLTLKGEKLDLSTLFKIENELDDLMLPYKIDLSNYHIIKNPGLIAYINRAGVVFYEKSGF